MRRSIARFLEINGILDGERETSDRFTLPEGDIVSGRNAMFWNGVIADRADRLSVSTRFSRVPPKSRLPYLL